MTATRTHLRDTDSARRTIAMGEAAKRRAAVIAWDALRVSPVTVKVRVPNERLLGLLLADREWTAEERDYVAAAERAGGEREL